MVSKRRRNESKRLDRLYRGPGGGGGGGGGGGASTSSAPSSSYNPFEYKHTSSRFDILGAKRKTNKGNNSAPYSSSSSRKQQQQKSRKFSAGKSELQKHDEGILKRKRSLLVEYDRRFSTNTFVDRRFGEDDETLNEEDRAILRFQRERVQQAKRNRFALNDDDDDDDNQLQDTLLTHKGRNLDDFDDSELRGYENDSGGEGDGDDDGFGFVSKRSFRDDRDFENMMTEFQFGNTASGGDEKEGGERKKSKKEVMQELIAKSKYFKGLKAKEKDEDETLRNKLDDDFKQIMQDADTMAALARLRRMKKDQAQRQRHERKSEADAGYDKIAEDLVFELRQVGAQAMPTREEIARKAKQRLEELEKQRLQMTQGDDAMLEDEDPDQVGGFRGRRMRQKEGADTFDDKLRKKKNAMEETGDDLGEDFVLSDEEEDGLSDESSYYSDSGEESEEEGEGEEGEELLEGIDEETGDVTRVKAKEKSSKADNSTEKTKPLKPPAKDKEEEEEEGGRSFSALPYVIPIPTSYKDFCELIEGFTPSQKSEILQRIRISNPVSLGPENRKNLQVFYGILLQYFVNQCKLCPLPVDTLNAIVPEIHVLTSEVPLYAATVAKARLDQMRRTMLKGSWPSKQMLATLQLYMELFDPQQPRHPVLTPMLLVMSKWLLFTPIRSSADIAKGLYLIKIIKKYIDQSEVLVPECLHFLKSIAKSVKVDSNDPGLLSLQTKSKAIEKAMKNEDVQVGDILHFDGTGATDDGIKTFDSVSFKLNAIEFTFRSIMDLCETYKKLPSAAEIFQPIVSTLGTISNSMSESSYGKKSGKKLQTIVESLEKSVSDCIATRPSLGNAFKEPAKAVRQFNPRFEEDYVQGKDYDIDRDRSERKRLQKELKRERRGAMRELRKDNRFLASVKHREETQQKDDVQNKYNSMFNFLQQQESDMRSGGQKGMIKLKRR